MSCSTQNQQPTQFTVTVGALPEGFCGTPQALAQAIADRLIIQVQQNLSSFVTGPVAPTSNVGPWLKNCEHWRFFDDATGTYRPDSQIPYSRSQYFTSDGNFIVPEDVYSIMIEAWGAGGGGSDEASSASGSGGGGGSYGFAIRSVVPAQVIPIVIGIGGGNGTPASNGSSTTILGMTAGGGTGATNNGTAGVGGTATGFDLTLRGGCGQPNVNNDNGSYIGGLCPRGGAGGVGDANKVGVVPGGGGGGSTHLVSTSGGSGANGAVFIRY